MTSICISSTHQLLRAREQQRPIPATSPPPDPNQNFNTFDFHAHTMPAYVMKQLYEESQQQKEKHPGSKLERSHSAENAKAQVIATPNSPYGKLNATPIIVGKNKQELFLIDRFNYR